MLSMAAIAMPLVIQAAPVTTENATITAIYGTGNPNTGWQQVADDTTGNILGIQAKDRTSGATPNDGAGTYTFASGVKWNIDFSVNYTAGFLSTSPYTYLLKINGGPGLNVETVFGDNAYGTSATLNGKGTVGTFAANSAANSILQNSEANTFSFINDIAPGTYNFELEAVNVDGTVVDSDSVNVQITPDSGPGILGLALVGGVLLFAKKRAAKLASQTLS
jgi:hypothetical protein